jgi:hypothetical protein
MIPVTAIGVPAPAPTDALDAVDAANGPKASTPSGNKPSAVATALGQAFEHVLGLLLGGVTPSADETALPNDALAENPVAGEQILQQVRTNFHSMPSGAPIEPTAGFARPRGAVVTNAVNLTGFTPIGEHAEASSALRLLAEARETGESSAADATPNALNVATSDATTVAAMVTPTTAAELAAVHAALAAGRVDAPVATGDAALATVSPELRDRARRVIDRMQREFGHTVSVVEGWRSQARQDALFAQGRTTEGPIVTWTRDSAHTDGLALDVMIDGGYDNADAFKRLGRIAAEEGLRTLGPKDPGHLELASPASLRTAADLRTAAIARADAAVSTPRAPVADVATVASVARVASPARVARVATVAAVAAPAASGDAAIAAAARSAEQSTATETARAVRATTRTERSSDALHPGITAPMPTTFASELPAAPMAVQGPDVAARLAAVERIRDVQASQPISRLIMDVPDANGGVDRIAVRMRGSAVDASLAIHDPVAAARLAARTDLLQATLEARGYESGVLQVRANGAIGTDAMDLARLAGVALDREGARGVASVLQDVSGGGLRDRSGSSSNRSNDSHHPQQQKGGDGDLPRRQSKRGGAPRE